ncbi:hypothetical protein [Jannaschia sp. CCS1]|uniref:hypothetical protein n=1 Tax=Jannaschia sp. (strain CCS1) TaxID=290400 RepID=UPI000053A531|nr:hypothetical protein [Jannaschia sp. CCS1]ABD54812.1 hypothetical protein Jann_1895 [Jannaschia sp. CCS1]
MTRRPATRLAALCALCVLPGHASAQGAVDALFDLLCGRTVHYYDTSGNQIEYTSGDGTAFLWFHGVEDVIVGTWAVYSDAEVFELQNDGSGDTERDGGLDSGDLFNTPTAGAQVCFEYPPGGFGPLDPGGFHCWDEVRLFETVVEGGVFPGDRYGLRDGEPPYLLPEHPFQRLETFDADFPQLPPEPACGVPIS